jgi:XisI protein
MTHPNSTAMGKIAHYRQSIQTLLMERADRVLSPGIEKQIIFDADRDHYQIVNVGWNPNGNRSYGCVLHLDIKDGKIWIQHDGTEDGIADALVELGVAKQDIVLGFHTPAMRKYTEFAIE